MTDYSFLIWAPLLTAAVWFFLAGYLVYQARYRTWTELFFLGLCASAGAYGLADAIFFSVPASPADPTLEASASLACLTVGSTFLLLYGVSLHGRLRLPMLLAFAPTVALILLFPTQMFKGFLPLPGVSAPRVPDYNQSLFVLWGLLIGAYWGVGVLQIARTVLALRRPSPAIARRIAVILAGFLLALVAGGLTNAMLGLSSSGNPQPPLFSSLLAVPGVLVFFAATPRTARRLNDAILRRKASLSDVKAAFLVFSDGTVIGSKVQPEEKMIDADSFSATLDVISNFMRTSFPTLRGKWLKSIRHGDYTLVLERGRDVYLTLVLSGPENDQLRRRMIEALDTFEEENAALLSHWRGVAKDAQGIDELLGSMLAAR